MKNVLRVFWTLAELGDTNGSRYKRTKQESDFPVDVTPEAAYAEIYAKNGKADNCTLWDKELGCWITPPRYAEINSHSIVDIEREKVIIESERILPENPLFDGLTLKKCLQDSPSLKSKKFAQKRKRK